MNVEAETEKVKVLLFKHPLIAVSIPPNIALGESFSAYANANVIICSHPAPNGTITLSILVLSKPTKVCNADIISGFPKNTEYVRIILFGKFIQRLKDYISTFWMSNRIYFSEFVGKFIICFESFDIYEKSAGRFFIV